MLRMIRLAGVLLLLVLPLACASHSTAQAKKLLSLHAQAEQAYAAQDYRRALELYKSLSKKLKHSADVWLRIGNCEARLGELDAAVSAYREALKYDSSHAKAWYNLSYVQAQQLANTVTEMYRQVDPNDPAVARARRLVVEVLEPFGLQGQVLEAAAVRQVDKAVGDTVEEPSSEP